ncbi:MAG: FapA family protein [Fibrobacteria bacterium]
MPKISVAVSGDAMGAKLRIEGFSAAEWKAEWSSGRRLRAILEESGIAAAGIRGATLDWVCATLDAATEASLPADLQAVQDVDVAQGTASVAEEPIGLAFHHAYIGDADAIEELRRKADDFGFDGLRDAIEPGYWVASGETVLTFQSASPGRPGMDVLGAVIPCPLLRDSLPPFGKSLFLNGRKLIAVCEGALIVEAGQIKVLGADSLPTCHVAVAEDKMSADLVLAGNYLNDWIVTLDMVRTALRRAKVMCMLPEAELRTSLARFNRDHLPLTLPIARGREPVAGRDGGLRLMVDPEPDIPLPARDGSIDFKEFSFFRTVAKDARLAQVLPPARGEPGMDVHGESIPAPMGKAFVSRPGINTALEGFDPMYLNAAVSGRLAIKAGVPEVVEVLEVEGDVSLKSGNVEFPGAVRVAGDVHSRMEIRSVGDVEVSGTVEDSVIRSDGAIVIRGGVNGTGKGIIKSRLSSVTIGYLHNQRIESHSHIAVYNEIISSTLLARRTIQMRFGRFSVLGGYLLAGEGMDLFNVGSENGGKTILEVGKDFEVEAELAAAQARMLEHATDLEFLRDMEDKLADVNRLRHGASGEDVLLHKRTQGGMEILQARIADLRARMAELGERLYNREPCEILLRGTAHPGTVIKYHDDVIVVTRPLVNRKWVFREKGAPPPPEGSPI